MSRALFSLLFSTLAILALHPAAVDAAPRGSAPERDPAFLVQEGQALLAEGDATSARGRFVDAVPGLRASGQTELLVGALAALATIDDEAGQTRSALDWWLQALPPADVLARAEGSANAQLGVFVRTRLAALLLESGDGPGSEQMGWDAVAEAVALARLELTAVGIHAVLRVAAPDGAAAIKERVVELDELLAGFDGYRLHSLPRPLPLAFMVEEVGREFAEAGAYDEAEEAFATATATYQALDAADLAARATVDLARASMERGRLRLAEDLLVQGEASLSRDAVAAELALRQGRPDEAARRFLALRDRAEGPEQAAVFLGRAARLVGLEDPARSASLHAEAAKSLRAAGRAADALVEDIHQAFQLGRAGAEGPQGDLLDRIAAARAADEPPLLPGEVEARLAVTLAARYERQGSTGLARDALATAGSALFKGGDTDGVAAVAAKYVDLALIDDDLPAADEALRNVAAVEESLGLRIDGWRRLAAEGRLRVAKGEASAVQSYAEAARRVAVFGRGAEPLREAPLFGTPASQIYAPWVQLQFEEGRLEDGWAALRQWRTWDRVTTDVDGQITRVREALREISTRATKEDPTVLREPLLAELGRLGEQVDEAPTCDMSTIRNSLGGATGLVDGVVLGGTRWTVLLDRRGFEVIPLAATAQPGRKHAITERQAGYRAVLRVGEGSYGGKAPQRFVVDPCRWGGWTPPSGEVVRVSEVPRPAGDPVMRVFADAKVPAPGLDGALVVAEEPLGERQIQELQRRGAGGVVVGAGLDADALKAALGKGLDKAVSAALPRKGTAQIWASPNR